MATLREDAGELGAELEARRPGVWRTLQAAHAKAQREPSYMPRYRGLLEQSLSRLQAEKDDVLPDDQLRQQCAEFFAWYAEECTRRGISDLEKRRGLLPHQDWMAKWLPREWEKFSAAFIHVINTGTKTSLAAMRPAAMGLLDSYANANDR
jgi:hypothetical protein